MLFITSVLFLPLVKMFALKKGPIILVVTAPETSQINKTKQKGNELKHLALLLSV